MFQILTPAHASPRLYRGCSICSNAPRLFYRSCFEELLFLFLRDKLEIITISLEYLGKVKRRHKNFVRWTFFHYHHFDKNSGDGTKTEQTSQVPVFIKNLLKNRLSLYHHDWEVVGIERRVWTKTAFTRRLLFKYSDLKWMTFTYNRLISVSSYNCLLLSSLVPPLLLPQLTNT
jgi:hypothetical protein